MRRFRRSGGFTLVELLTVMAVLAILMGLILGGINTAIGSGKKVQCQSQLRQIYLAMRMYAADNDGLFPYVNNDNPVHPGNGPMVYLGSYLENPSPNILQCTNPKSSSASDSYYYYNDLFLTNFPTNPDALSASLGDAVSDIYIFGCRFSGGEGFYPHSAGVNTLFSDGHVEYQRKK